MNDPQDIKKGFIQKDLPISLILCQYYNVRAGCRASPGFKTEATVPGKGQPYVLPQRVWLLR